MKKSLLLILSLPLLLASCDLSTGSGSSKQTSETTTDTTGQSEEKTDTGTEGSGTGTTTGGGTDEGTTGGGTTGGGETTGGGTTGGGETTGGGTTGEETGQQTTTTISKDTTELGLSGDSKPESISLNSDISLEFSIGTNSYKNKPTYKADESIRLYGGNTLTIKNSKGAITKIEFSYSPDKKENVFSADTGSYSDSSKLWTGSSSKIVFSVGGTSGHLKLYSLKVTYTTTGGGSTTGGGETTGGGTTGGGTTGGGTTTGGGVDDGANYISTWPENYQPFVTTYLNGMLPCFLNTNKKNLFTGYMTGHEVMYDEYDNPHVVPYFNPYVKNTSPGINYEYNYGTILRNAGFKQTDEFYDDEIEATVYYYQKGNCYVQYNKHQSDEDHLYYFDVYAYYDYYYTGSFKNAYDIQYDNKELALTNSYDSNNKTVKVGNWNVTLSNVEKHSESIQLKADTGSIAINGSLKGLIIEPLLTANAEALFVKAGTSASNAKYIFNNGGYFEFPSGTTYAEISAKYRVLNIEYFDIIY